MGVKDPLVFLSCSGLSSSPPISSNLPLFSHSLHALISQRHCFSYLFNENGYPILLPLHVFHCHVSDDLASRPGDCVGFPHLKCHPSADKSNGSSSTAGRGPKTDVPAIYCTLSFSFFKISLGYKIETEVCRFAFAFFFFFLLSYLIPFFDRHSLVKTLGIDQT